MHLGRAMEARTAPQHRARAAAASPEPPGLTAPAATWNLWDGSGVWTPVGRVNAFGIVAAVKGCLKLGFGVVF